MKIPELTKKALSAVGECPDLDFPAVARVGENQREIGLLDEPRRAVRPLNDTAAIIELVPAQVTQLFLV